MYLCLDCRRTFEEPRDYTEEHGLPFPPYETWSGCPFCAGAYVETVPCDNCGKWVTDEYIQIDDDTIICEDCYEIKNIQDMRW